jgi:hypothetical protein
MTYCRVVLAVLAVASCGDGGSKIAIRYHPPAGAVYHYALEQKTQVTLRSGPLTGLGKQQLNMRMHFTQVIKGPATGVVGNTEVEVTFDSTSMEMPGVPADAMERELAKMRGLRSTVVFDERAQIVRTDFGQHQDATPEMRNQMAAGIKAMTFAFPEQPVGRGDSWSVNTELPIGELPGNDASQAGAARTTLTVREIHAEGADTTVVLDIKTEFPTGPVRLTIAGQQGTMTMSGALTGNQRFSVTRGAVTEATLKGAMTMNVTIAMFGAQKMVMMSETENALRLVDAK